MLCTQPNPNPLHIIQEMGTSHGIGSNLWLGSGWDPFLGMRTDGNPTPDPSRGIGMTL